MSAIIDEIVATIRQARYGRDVRESIARGIELIDDVAEDAQGSASASATEAATAARNAEQSASNAQYYAEHVGDNLTLGGISDVTITSPTNNQVLKYDATNQVWVNGEGGGNANAILFASVLPETPTEEYSGKKYLYLGENTEHLTQGHFYEVEWISDSQSTTAYWVDLNVDCDIRTELTNDVLETENIADGKCVLYVGATTSQYKQGCVYRFHKSSSPFVREWQLVVDLSGGSSDIGTVIATDVAPSTAPTSADVGKTIIYFGTTSGIFKYGHIYQVIEYFDPSSIIEWRDMNYVGLNDLWDVTVSSPTNGQVLKYDATNRVWINGNESGGGGTTDYTDLTNKPSINGVTLSGNKTTSDLGLNSVEANPSGSATATLTKIDVDGTVYGIPQGAVTSVNTKTGAVVLDATDINYDSNTTVKAKIDTKVDAVNGKGLSSNDYTDADKTAVGTIGDKVDKVQGKGLSTEDYTTAEKNKLSGIETGAEVNTVNSVNGDTGAVVIGASDIDYDSTNTVADKLNQKPEIIEKTYSQYLADKTALDASGNIIKITDSGLTNSAVGVSYDNTNSGLSATNVQGAIDEVKSNLSVHSTTKEYFKASSANTWVSTGVKLTVPAGHLYIGRLYTTYVSGAPIAFAISTSASALMAIATTEVSNADTTHHSVGSPVFMSNGTDVYVWEKRATVPSSNNEYWFTYLDITT